MQRFEVFGLDWFARDAASRDTRQEVDVAALVERYAGLLFRVAHSVLRSRTEAEDVVQDVFVRVLERRAALPDVQEMRVWLVRIAWNLALDRKRRIKPEQMDAAFAAELAGREVTAEVALRDAQAMTAVLREMDRLPGGEREVLVLAAIEELSTAEMAAVLGRSESAVRALLSRARARLKGRVGR